MKKRGWTWAVFGLAAWMMGSHAPAAELTAIRLEAVRSREAFGPFMIDREAPVVIGGDMYRLERHANGKISFHAQGSNEVQGPYEVTQGRILKIGGDLYTIVEITRHSAPISTAPRPSRASRSPAAHGTREESGPIDRGTVREPQPARPAAASPRSSAEWQAARDRMRQQYADRRQSSGFGRGMGVSLDLSVFERTDLRRELNGVAVDDVRLERRSASVAVRTERLVLTGGMVLDAEWDDPIPGEGLAFSNAELQDGDGWWVSAELRNALWAQDEWTLDFNAVGSYRRETYALSYQTQQAAGTVIIGETNGTSGTVVQLYEMTPVSDDTELTESLLSIGLSLSRVTPAWSCFFGFDVIVLEDIDLDTAISTASVRYDVDLERVDPLSISAGASLKHWGVHWFADLSLIGEDSLRLGAAFVF